MANLYLIEIEIEYKGVEFLEFVKTWLEDVNFYLEEERTGKAKQLWKVVGERKVYIVIEKNDDELDKMMFETPLIKKLGDQAKATVTKLLIYEIFANNTNELIKSNVHYEVTEPVERVGMYFWAEFNVGYTGHSMDELLHTWSEEAAAALGAKSTGIVVDLWKCVGMRRVHALLNFDSLSELDMMLFTVPLMEQNGNNVDIKIKPVIKFDCFAHNLKPLTEQ